MADIFTVEHAIALLTLTVLEIVLGIDNVIFIAILSSKLPAEQQDRARQLGIGLAVISRILLLLAINVVISLNDPFFSIAGHGFSGHDLILLIGGLFLIGKSTREIHEKLEALDDNQEKRTPAVIDPPFDSNPGCCDRYGLLARFGHYGRWYLRRSERL